MNFFYKIGINTIFSILAALGALGGLYLFVAFQKTAPAAEPFVPTITPPFLNFILGAGIIEAQSENIEMGTLIEGVVEDVLVKPGDKVLKGQPLFTLDNRQALADLQVKKALLASSHTSVEQAKISFQSAKNQFELVKSITDKRAVSKEEFSRRQDDFLLAKKTVEKAVASLKVAEAQVNQALTLIDFYVVKAPIEGEIIQVNLQNGENTATKRKPLMLIGSVSRYYTRVDIDEYDAWRFNKSHPAVAFLRGNPQYHTPLKFEYIEPYVVPKKSLTDDYNERVDTRVLRVIYSFDPKKMPSYLGQQVDVYIKADKIPSNIKFGTPVRESQ